MAPAAAAATVSSWIPPTLPECDGYDMRCYIADLPNATTARCATSTGLPIQVSFHAARPPLLSHLCVHCPGLGFLHAAPKVVATDADLVLLRVPTNPSHTATIRFWDYFLYSPRARRLLLLPNPGTDSFGGDSATALLSRDGGASFAVAAIGCWHPVFGRDGRTITRWGFDLHLYRSSSGSGGRSRWTTRRMSIKELVRDAAVPLPDSVIRLYHETGKAVTVGGERGTVAWVDLWRGILFIDVLADPPVLRDVPLPVPARGNWSHLLGDRDPGHIRDVAVSRNRGTIKYVEMEIRPRTVVRTMPDSYFEWVRGGSVRSEVIPGSWKATTWSMAAAPGGSWTDWRKEWTDWRKECEVEAKDIAVDASGDLLLSKLSGRATLLEVPVAYPTVSMDDDTVYLLSRTEYKGGGKLDMVVAVDVRNKTLRGAAKLDAQKNFMFMPAYCTSEICRYLSKSTGGTSEDLESKRTEKEAAKPAENAGGKPTMVRQRRQLKTSG